MTITLDNSNLLNYFPGVDRQLPAFFHHPDAGKLLSNFDIFNPYYFKSQNSDTLLVTLGDSWTWASECSGTEDFFNFCAKDWLIDNRVILNINQDRINHAYGNILSDTIGCDWLNLGVPAWGNLQIAELIKHLSRIIPDLDYKKIIVVCTFTEVGRWFNTEEDQHVDHARLINKVEETKNVNSMLAELNHLVIDQITASLDPYPQVQLLVGTNFVDHIGFDHLRPEQILPVPWYQLLGISYDIPVYIGTLISISGFERGLTDGLIPKKLKPIFKSWIISAFEQSDMFYKSLRPPYFLSSKQHPLFDGHKVWADYILQHIS